MTTRREDEILKYIDEKRNVRFGDLCERFAVSPATMRRNLVTLEKEGLIERYHGGARSIHEKMDPNRPINQRISTRIDEKELIANYAFSLIHNNDSIILDASTTCLKLAEKLRVAHKKLTVITNYFSVAQTLEEIPELEILFVGGIVCKGYSSTSGSIAEQTFSNIHADIAFLGADGVDPIRGLSNNRLDAIDLKKIMISNSRKVYALMDHTKFSISAVLQFATLQDIDGIITDFGLPDGLWQLYGEKRDKIIRVGGNLTTKDPSDAR